MQQHHYSPRRWAGAIVLACFSVCVAALPQHIAAQEPSQTFPQTGFTVAGKFLQYWQQHGGLAIFGYPISAAHNEVDPITGKTYLTQWFERERFELHPEHAGTPYEVELGLLGRQLTQGRETETPFERVATVLSTPDRVYFPETGHTLAAGFKAYWQRNGGLAIFGYPLSQEFAERNASDGQTYTVQYFERARYEYHPANPAAYQVELGLLGSLLHGTATPPAAGSTVINVSADSANRPIQPNATALLPPATSDITVAIHWAQAVDPRTVRVNLVQFDQAAHWQVVPNPQASTADTFVFAVRGTYTGGSYFRAEVAYGTDNTPVIFGVQIDSALPNRPNLSANWTDPAALVNSYYNAVNRYEYERAWSYWERPGAPNAAPANFTDFVNGYAETAHVDLLTGTVVGDAGAGNIYAAVPVALTATLLNGGTQHFYGCYLLHQINVPQGDTVPPYPLFLRAARIMAAPANASPAALLDQANQFVQAGKCTQ